MAQPLVLYSAGTWLAYAIAQQYYVIPYAGVARLVTRVEVAKRAHPLAEELIIERLPRKLFDTMELRRR